MTSNEAVAAHLWGWHMPAQFSDCGRFRYTLTRDLRSLPVKDKPGPTRRRHVDPTCLRARLQPSLFGEVTERPSLVPEKRALFVMLNPSTATDTVNDPTITRCMRFALAWGYDRLAVCNLFALRSTDPSVLRSALDAEGDPENITTILTLAQHADLIVCAWGAHGAVRDRAELVTQHLFEAGHQLHALKLTKDGHPGHPLYLRGDSRPVAMVAA